MERAPCFFCESTVPRKDHILCNWCWNQTVCDVLMGWGEWFSPRWLKVGKERWVN